MWHSLKALCSRVLASFASHSCLPRLLHGELLMDKRDSNGFFSTWRVCTCMVSHRSSRINNSSLIVAFWQKSFLLFCAAINCWHSTTALWHTWYCHILSYRLQCTFSWLQYYTLAKFVMACNNNVPGSMWATCGTNTGHAMLLSALAPRVSHYSACFIGTQFKNLMLNLLSSIWLTAYM